MLKKQIPIIFAIMMLMISCNKKTEAKQDLALDDSVEVWIKRDQESIDKYYKQKEKDQEKEVSSFDDKIIYGLWFTPHDATHCITFYEDHTFKFNDFVEINDGKDIKNIVRTGTFTQKRDSIYLKCENGWHMSLRHWECWGKNKGTYITKGNKGNWEMYLVKSSLE